MERRDVDNQLELEPEPDGKDEGKEKERDLEAIRQELLADVAATRLDTDERRVAWVLNHYPEARNSDVALYIRYWREFENELVDGEYVRLKNIFKLKRPASLNRARRRLQNEYNLFLASPEVRAQRGTLSEEEKEKALESHAPYPMYTAYTDESGKTNDYLVVGAVWFLDGHEIREVTSSVEALAEKSEVSAELHFKEIDWGSLDYYKSVADLVITKAATISFTSISVDRRGHKHVGAALEAMHKHLLIRGVEHQHETGRAPLPRSLSVFKDQEEIGRDKLLMAQLEEDLLEVSHTRLESKLTVDRMSAVDSKGSIPVQLADLWVSSVSRVLNATGKRNSARDEFADYLLERVGIPEGPAEEEIVGDIVVHLSL